LHTVIKAIAAAYNIKGTAKQAILEAFGTAFHGLAKIPHFAVDEERCAP